MSCAAAILLEFKGGLTDPTGALSSWQPGPNPCSAPAPWGGVLCDSERRVTGLRLEGRRLRGRLAGSLAWVDRLSEIHLAGNELFGERLGLLLFPVIARALGWLLLADQRFLPPGCWVTVASKLGTAHSTLQARSPPSGRASRC